MKIAIMLLLLFISNHSFSQNTNPKKIDSACIYIKFISTQYKPTIAAVYTSSQTNVFSQDVLIPSNVWMRYNCDSVKPCFVNVDYTYPDRKPLLVKGQFFKGDSLIVDMDSRLTTIIRKK